MTEPTATNRNQCSEKRKDGQPCTAPALINGKCFAHAPEMAAKRTAARKSGGRNRSGIVRMRGLIPPRLVAVYDLLEQALSEVHVGSLDARQAQAMASIARAMVAVLTAGELEERLRKIEQANEEHARRYGA